MLAHDPALDIAPEREQIGASAFRLAPLPYRATDHRHHQIARLERAHIASHCSDARQALVTQHQKAVAYWRKRLLGQQNLPVRATDAELERLTEHFTRLGRRRLRHFD
jgi:hypothetical protein